MGAGIWSAEATKLPSEKQIELISSLDDIKQHNDKEAGAVSLFIALAHPQRQLFVLPLLLFIATNKSNNVGHYAAWKKKHKNDTEHIVGLHWDVL